MHLYFYCTLIQINEQLSLHVNLVVCALRETSFDLIAANCVNKSFYMATNGVRK